MLYYDYMDKFSAISDPTRRSIVEMLARNGELSATEISSHFQMSPPAVSQHLKILRESQLVVMEKRAQQRIYRINPAAVRELEGWASNLMQLWTQRFEALDALLAVEKEKLAQARKRKEDSNERP
jgi:DNA-binding transcriptional ArsR family regulator